MTQTLESNENHEERRSAPIVPIDDRLLDVAFARQFLSLSDSGVRKLVRTGALAHVRVGKRLLFLKADLDAYVASQRRPAGLQDQRQAAAR